MPTEIRDLKDQISPSQILLILCIYWACNYKFPSFVVRFLCKRLSKPAGRWILQEIDRQDREEKVAAVAHEVAARRHDALKRLGDGPDA